MELTRHLFDLNPIARIRLVHQYMGHGAHQTAVLDNRGAGHE